MYLISTGHKVGDIFINLLEYSVTLASDSEIGSEILKCTRHFFY